MTSLEQFSKRRGHHILQNQSNKRISENASIELMSELEQHAEEIAEAATENAKEDDRTTVRKEDIRKAVRRHSE